MNAYKRKGRQLLSEDRGVPKLHIVGKGIWFEHAQHSSLATDLGNALRLRSKKGNRFVEPVQNRAPARPRLDLGQERSSLLREIVVLAVGSVGFQPDVSFASGLIPAQQRKVGPRKGIEGNKNKFLVVIGSEQQTAKQNADQIPSSLGISLEPCPRLPENRQNRIQSWAAPQTRREPCKTRASKRMALRTK